MILGIDYDGTWSEAPDLFSQLVPMFQDAGHECVVVTRRDDPGDDMYPAQEVRDAIGDLCPIVFCGQHRKDHVASEAGYDVDVWIDDNPALIVNDRTPEDLKERGPQVMDIAYEEALEDLKAGRELEWDFARGGSGTTKLWRLGGGRIRAALANKLIKHPNVVEIERYPNFGMYVWEDEPEQVIEMARAKQYDPNAHPNTTAQVNAFLRQQGLGEYELVRGRGYYYWVGTNEESDLETAGWETDSVSVYRVYEMTYQQWLDDLKDKIETNSPEYEEELMRSMAKHYNIPYEERSMRMADRLIERELREMAVSPKQQEILDLIQRHKTPIYPVSAFYGGRKGRETMNYEMRGWSAVSDRHISKRLPTRLVSELIKNKALEFIQADDGYGSWSGVLIPKGDDPADYNINVWAG